MKVRVNPDYCKGCHLCIDVCPHKVFEEGDEPSDRGYLCPEVAHPERCPNHEREVGERMVCERCVLTCPDQALTWEEEG
jgi:2-oxoglutarate ferredoxin oxidoreductase subunit delta